MALTKLPIELIQGNGSANNLVTNVGDSLEVGDVPSSPAIEITDISYDTVVGAMNISLSNSETISVYGFVKARDLPRGLPGRPGRSGRSGLPGITGYNGKQGELGPRGFKGLKGLKGLPGPQGYAGIAGNVGEVGDRGDRGAEGSQGSPGSKGDTGDVGDTGRSSLLPIVVSDGDPGAIGAGALWVKPSKFKYGDPVNFTLTDNKDEIICRDTIEMLQAAASGLGQPDWYYTKDLAPNQTESYSAQYLASTFTNASYYIVANFEALTEKQTCIITPNSIAPFETLLSNPLIVEYNKYPLIIDSKKIYYQHYVYPLDVEVNTITVDNNLLYLTSAVGFFVYDMTKKSLSKYYDYPCNKCFVHSDNVYIGLTDNTTLITSRTFDNENLFEGIPFFDDSIIFVQYVDNYVNAYSYDETLLYRQRANNIVGDYVLINNSYFKVSLTGLQYAVTTKDNFIKSDFALIEWTENKIFVESLL